MNISGPLNSALSCCNNAMYRRRGSGGRFSCMDKILHAKFASIEPFLLVINEMRYTSSSKYTVIR